MRVMVFAKAADDNATSTPLAEDFAAMDRYTEELVQAGVFVAAAGLKNTFEAKRVISHGSVVDGPFPDNGELVAGFSIWNVKDMEEAVAWAKRSPMPGVIELRPFYEAGDLADLISPEELATTREGERWRLGVA